MCDCCWLDLWVINAAVVIPAIVFFHIFFLLSSLVFHAYFHFMFLAMATITVNFVAILIEPYCISYHITCFPAYYTLFEGSLLYLLFFFITGLRILTPFHVTTVEASGEGNVGNKKKSTTPMVNIGSGGGGSGTAAPGIGNSSA